MMGRQPDPLISPVHSRYRQRLCGCDLVNISVGAITRHELQSRLRTSDNEEPDVSSEVNCIDVDDDFAIAAPVHV